MVYLTNAFSINMLAFDEPTRTATVKIKEIDIRTAYTKLICALAADKLVNAIGHRSTDTVALAEVEKVRILSGGAAFPKGQRLTVRMGPEDTLIVVQYVGPRLEEGATELPAGAELRWYQVELAR